MRRAVLLAAGALAPADLSRTEVAAARVGDSIYYDIRRDRWTLEAYDPRRRRWSRLPDPGRRPAGFHFTRAIEALDV